MLKIKSLNENFRRPPAMAKTNPPIPNRLSRMHKIMIISIFLSLPVSIACVFPDILVFERFFFFNRHYQCADNIAENTASEKKSRKNPQQPDNG